MQADTLKRIQERLASLENREHRENEQAFQKEDEMKIDMSKSLELDLFDIVVGRKQLGKGHFGSVYSGKYKGDDVAIKLINEECLLDDVIQEISILHMLNFPCLIRQYGYCSGGDKAMVVMELADDSLSNLKSSMSSKEKLRALRDVAHCLCAIHDRREGAVIHCDIAAKNILRRKDGSFCLADFGLARVPHDGKLFY